jgi:hypothetical protein
MLRKPKRLEISVYTPFGVFSPMREGVPVSFSSPVWRNDIHGGKNIEEMSLEGIEAKALMISKVNYHLNSFNSEGFSMFTLKAIEKNTNSVPI